MEICIVYGSVWLWLFCVLLVFVRNTFRMIEIQKLADNLEASIKHIG